MNRYATKCVIPFLIEWESISNDERLISTCQKYFFRNQMQLASEVDNVFKNKFRK